MTESSMALDSGSERGNMTRGHYLKISDELECKFLDNCPPINISTTVYIAGKEQTKESTYFELNLITLLLLSLKKCMYVYILQICVAWLLF